MAVPVILCLRLHGVITSSKALRDMGVEMMGYLRKAG